MEKIELVAKIQRQLGTKSLKSEDIESVIDATLAEMVTPSVFYRPGERVSFFDNDCNNNCKEELARVSPDRSR